MGEQQDGHEETPERAHEETPERAHEEEEHAHEPGRAESDALADY